MSTAQLDSLITLSPGFKTAVNLKQDIEDDTKLSSYIPTQMASEILLDLAENLHPLAGRRARVVTGTYGTGKSHLALVVARVYRDGIDCPALIPVREKLQKWPGQKQKLEDERRKIDGKFLLVLIEGDEGSLDDVLLRSLDMALEREGLGDLLPETAFGAALGRIAEIRDEHQETYQRFEEAAKDSGLESVTVLEEQLKAKLRSAYDKFLDLHVGVCAGAPFIHHHATAPKDVYASVASKLVEDKGYAGICVVWDEFGRYMERVVDDPRGLEGESLQRFAECCNGSGRVQIHFYIICHRSLQEYVRISNIRRTTGMSNEDEQEWNRIAGRFKPMDMRSTDHEVYDLIDHVIVQNTDEQGWKDFVKGANDYFDEWTEEASRLRLFPEFTRDDVRQVVTLGAYPLHPMAAFCLPRISQRVAQNERTLFRFLSDSGSDTLGPFLHEAKQPAPGACPPAFSAERLWAFFEKDVSEQPLQKRAYAKYQKADAMVPPDDELGKQVIRTVALLNVISTDRAPCTQEIIGYCLALSTSDLSVLREKLKSLCNKEGGREKVLVQSINDESYRFTGSSSDDFESKIEQFAEERARLINPLDHLRRIASELQIDNTIPATGYSDDFMVARSLTTELVSLQELDSPSRWTTSLGAGEFKDGYALYVVCEDAEEVRRAKDVARTKLKSPQVLIGIPKEPIRSIGTLLRKHEAIRFLEKEQANLYGEGAELREEWEQQDRDYRDSIGRHLLPVLEPDNRLMDWFIDGDELPSITSVSRLRGAASDMMSKVFPLTPRINHERLTTEEGRDNFVATRKSIITKLLMRDGPEQLAKETTAQSKTVIDFVYRRNGILRMDGAEWAADIPDENAYPAMRAVWLEVERSIDAARTASLPMKNLVSSLRTSPYGMRTRSISLIVAAVFRPHIQRGNISFECSGPRATTRISKLDGDAIDNAIMSPDGYALVYTDVGQKAQAIIAGFADVFGVPSDEADLGGTLLEGIHQAVIKWWRGLPSFAQQTAVLDRETLAYRDQVFRKLAQESADAYEILMEFLPSKLYSDSDVIAPEAVSAKFSKAKSEIDNAVSEHLVPKVIEVVTSVFQNGKTAKTDSDESLVDWFTNLPEEKRETRASGDAAILARHANSATTGETAIEHTVIDLAKQISGTSLENWGDDMLGRFQGRLEGAKQAVEVAETASIVVPPPPPGQVQISINAGDTAFRRTFVPASEISQMGENLRNIVKNAVDGIGRTLPSGECETILIEIIKDTLK